ncbi:mercury resistance system periplasmic binding protein MerP [Hahella aquimaris]|uniref:mercury resistance system periplasmic binding protein MerP n=1 Tax=Hahella sp. HNIBRBA332 TaxID=3015983 RepID=UPI00273B21D3|nr:mercury resistance system periplasmic binding protein MerP [Hahella sp. HNIBRBA332]WLQ13292.1 mercury resistance system periplasmic binding protein MerP [Hahella sp. HNIBRBA332]
MSKILPFFFLLTFAVTTTAAESTVILSVPGMNCPICPITVKKALIGTEGVRRAEVSLEKRQALVIFDDAVASVASLTQATRNAGYPSHPEGASK